MKSFAVIRTMLRKKVVKAMQRKFDECKTFGKILWFLAFFNLMVGIMAFVQGSYVMVLIHMALQCILVPQADKKDTQAEKIAQLMIRLDSNESLTCSELGLTASELYES